MQNDATTNNAAPGTAASSTGELNAQGLHEVEELTNELKRLLVRHEKTLKEEGIRSEVETLERWLESCRRGLAAAEKISGTGMDWLANIRNHLKLAADELQRLEGEGGNVAPSREQAEKADELTKAVARLDKLLPDFEQIFGHKEIKENV